mgnify:CR=1 FL=1
MTALCDNPTKNPMRSLNHWMVTPPTIHTVKHIKGVFYSNCIKELQLIMLIHRAMGPKMQKTTESMTKITLSNRFGKTKGILVGQKQKTR